MLLLSSNSQRAFALVWVMLAMGAMGVLAMGLSVWVWVEAQRAQLRMGEAQARFASQAVLRQVLGDLQRMLGPDMRVVECSKTGQYTVWDSGGWDSLNPMDRDGLVVGVLGMKNQDRETMRTVTLSGAKYVCAYRYSLTPGWDVDGTAYGLAMPKRVLADVRQGRLCQALDKQDDWVGSDALIWDADRWSSVNFMGPTRGQLESFLRQRAQGIIVSQSSVENAKDTGLPRVGANLKSFAHAKIQRPMQMARYLRPVKIELDCFLKAAHVQAPSVHNVQLDLEIVAVAKVGAINPYDNEMAGGAYILELNNCAGLEKFFSIHVKTPSGSSPFLGSPKQLGYWSMDCVLMEAFSKTDMEGKERRAFISVMLGIVSSNTLLIFPDIGNTGFMTVENCRWKLGINKDNACELESMENVSLNWHPSEMALRGLTVGSLIQQNQVFLGSFTTEYLVSSGLPMVGRQVWAPSNFHAPQAGQDKIRWAMSTAVLGESLQIPSFVKLRPRSVMDVIHWGEWNPYQWAEGMPFCAIRPVQCKATEYMFKAGARSNAQMLDIAWLMGETLLDKYYLSEQMGAHADSPGWADYGLNVNDDDPERWARQLEAFLSAEQAKQLGEACVDILKQRGPFMGIADFVNRRLVDSAQGECGAFEAACEQVGISHPERLEIIARLLPSLSAREDAWTIDIEVEIHHAESLKIQGRKRLRAWVQRDIGYLDGAESGEPVGPLSLLNDSFGRKWRVVAMQWL